MTRRLPGSSALRATLTIALLILAVAGSGCAVRSATEAGRGPGPGLRPEPPTRVFLVRHAEKVAGVQDPPLTGEGQARARALAHALADAGIQTIYSTEFARTRATAQAVAEATGREVRIFPIGDAGVDAFILELAREIVDRQAGHTVLVVGHSNTVPALMRALGATQADDLTEEDYDDLFLVEPGPAGSARLLQLHYGAPSP